MSGCILGVIFFANLANFIGTHMTGYRGQVWTVIVSVLWVENAKPRNTNPGGIQNKTLFAHFTITRSNLGIATAAGVIPRLRRHTIFQILTQSRLWAFLYQFASDRIIRDLSTDNFLLRPIPIPLLNNPGSPIDAIQFLRVRNQNPSFVYISVRAEAVTPILVWILRVNDNLIFDNFSRSSILASKRASLVGWQHLAYKITLAVWANAIPAYTSDPNDSSFENIFFVQGWLLPHWEALTDIFFGW
jgi:hypothetical protein